MQCTVCKSSVVFALLPAQCAVCVSPMLCLHYCQCSVLCVSLLLCSHYCQRSVLCVYVLGCVCTTASTVTVCCVRNSCVVFALLPALCAVCVSAVLCSNYCQHSDSVLCA